MADYFTQFSASIDRLTEEERAWLTEQLDRNRGVLADFRDDDSDNSKNEESGDLVSDDCSGSDHENPDDLDLDDLPFIDELALNQA
jgi:hypothetical protein